MTNNPKLIVILSGKGGVGKSTIVNNLAVSLTEKGYKIGIIDSDIHSPSLPVVAGMTIEKKLNITDDIFIPHEHNGIKIISLAFMIHPHTAILWDDSQKQEIIVQMMKVTEWGELDYLLIDCPAGSGGEVYASLKELNADGAIVVSNPDPAALISAKKCIRLLEVYQTPFLGIINNMTQIVCPKCHFHWDIPIETPAFYTEDETLGSIPFTRTIRETNIVPDFYKITDKVLIRLSKLKKAKNRYAGEGIKSRIHRKALKTGIKKLGPKINY